MAYYIGDIVQMKKKHPCGNDLWEITRIGVDFRIKCQKCFHSVMLSRQRFEKQVKTLHKRGEGVKDSLSALEEMRKTVQD